LKDLPKLVLIEQNMLILFKIIKSTQILKLTYGEERRLFHFPLELVGLAFVAKVVRHRCEFGHRAGHGGGREARSLRAHTTHIIQIEF
jgi:hypothetical protein